MMWSRRVFIQQGMASVASIAMYAAPAKASGFSIAEWLQLGKVIGDVADGLDHVIATLRNGATATLSGVDVLQARSARSRLTLLSATMSNLSASQGAFAGNIDAYGDLWRRLSNNGSITLRSTQIDQLQNLWSSVIENIHDVLQQISAAMAEMKADAQDFAISNAYRAMAQALAAKVGLLDRLARSPTSITREDMRALVNSEENFPKLRSALNNAVDVLNDYIQRK